MSAPPRRGRPIAVEEPIDGGIGSFVAAHRAGLGAVAVVAVAALAGWSIWSRVADSASAHPDGVLATDAVDVRGVASWVRCDLKAEALRNASLDGGLPLNDPELARRLARAFDMHPWVRQVVAVTLRHPAAATVQILCREPVAMVSVKGGLLAIDAEAVVLPSADFTADAAALYPRITGVDSSPQGPEGSPWGDPVVEEGAALAVAIGPEWKPLGLTECRPTVTYGQRRWELIGPPPRTIRFGSAPGREGAGEPSAAAKIARLRSLVSAPITTDGVDLTVADEADEEDAVAPTATAPKSIPLP